MREIALWVMFVTVVGWSVTMTCHARPPRRPNIVFIFTDDQGYGDLGCFGNDRINTPNLDRMAAEGARLTSFYAMPLCTPSRAALMTGCYPVRVGLGRGSRHAVLLAGDAHGLNPDEITVAELLRSAGYATGMFGKWHLGDQPEFLPTRQGFDVFYGLPYSHDIFPPNQHARYHFPPLPLLDGERVVEVNPDPDRLTGLFTDKAIAFIQAHRDQPFFVYLAHPMPHRPVHASRPYIERSTRISPDRDYPIDNMRARDVLYPAAIDEVDAGVGRIFDTLKSLGLDEDTLVIFTSDNGPAAGGLGRTAPLRGRKGSIQEGGLREPCIVRWPGHIPAGQTIDAVTCIMDWLPTLTGLGGGDLPVDRAIDGRDIWPLLSGQSDPSPHEAFYYYQGNQLKAVRQGPWKLMVSGALYQLHDDPAEQHNLAADHPDIVARLKRLIQKMDHDIRSNHRPCGMVQQPAVLSE